MTPNLAVMPFVTPWLFYAGAAATSVPIAIHLLTRRRYRRVFWAAMEFLLAAQKRNAKRLRFQRWLLLALRCLALILLGAGVAQLFLRDSALGHMLSADQRATVIVWDDSYSLGYQPAGGSSHFDDGRRLLTDLLDHMSGNERVAVIPAARGASALAPALTLDHDMVRREVRLRQPSDAATDLPTALDAAAGLLDAPDVQGSTKRVILVTDLSRSSLLAGASDEAAGREAVRKAVAQLEQVAPLEIADVGAGTQANAGVTELSPERAIVVAGAPTELVAGVTNGSDRAMVDVPVTFTLDGAAAGTATVSRVEPGQEASVRLALTIGTPGRHLIEAKLPGDALPVDDIRRLMVDAAPNVPVLLVDGDPGDARSFGSTTYLKVALAPIIDNKSTSIFAPRVVTELELPRTPLGDYAAVALSDVGPLDKATVSSLQDFVNTGGMLLIFPGDRTRPAELNRALGSDGANLLPAPMGQVVRLQTADEIGAGLQFDPMNYAHPVLRPFAAAAKAGQPVGLNTAQTQQYIKLDVPQNAGVETVLRFTDQSPAVVLKRVGKGMVVEFATSADTSWTSFPAKPSFPEFVWELMLYGVQPRGGTLTLPVNGQLHLPASVANPGTWNAPGNTQVQVRTAIGQDGAPMLVSDPLRAAGVYGPAAGDQRPVVAVNPDPEEADIRYIAPRQYAEALGVPAGRIQEHPTSLVRKASPVGDVQAAGSNLGLLLLVLAAAVLGLETMFARMFSVYR